jgi:arylsulfatase A-like enzyme
LPKKHAASGVRAIHCFEGKYLLPLNIGILAGLISFWHAELDNLSYYAYYFRFHLYYTGFKALSSAVDSYALRWVVAWYFINLGVRLCVLFGDRHRISAILLPLTLFFSLYARTLWDQHAGPGALSLLWALLLVLGLVFYIRIVLQWPGTEQNLQARVAAGINDFAVHSSAALRRFSLLFAPFVLALLAVNLGLGVLWAQRSLTAQREPNIILIMVDTLRADHLGCYGYSRHTSPNIDRFASGSIRFEHALSQAPFTEWSVPSFLSSKYPQTDEPEYVTLQEFLTDRGYTTVGVVSNLWQYGVSAYPHQAFQHWDADPSIHAADISSPAVLSESIKWLDKVKDRRFFLFSLFVDPHTPYIKHARYDFDPENDRKLPNRVDLNLAATDPGTSPPCDVQHMEALYDSEIAYTDEHIGLLLDRLKKDGLYDNSLIVLLSDHGEEFEDHGALFHTRTLYRELLSVPLIIKLPNERKGIVANGCYSLIGLFPSLVSCLGIDPAPLNTHGKAVVLNSLREVPEEYIYSANTHKRSIQNTQFKLIHTFHSEHHKDRYELYDIARDPFEKRDIARESSSIVRSLQRPLSDHEKQIGADYGGGMLLNGGAVSSEGKERLKGLGYLAR